MMNEASHHETDSARPNSSLISRIARTGSLVIFCFALVFRLLSRFNFAFYLDASGFQGFVSALFFVSLLFYLCARLSESKLTIPSSPALVIVTLFFFWVGISTLFSSYSFASFMAFGTWSSYFSIFLLVFLMAANDRSLLIYPVATVLSSIVVQMLYGMYQYFFLYPDLAERIRNTPSVMEGIVSQNMRQEFRNRVFGGEPAGTLISPNTLVALCALGVLLAVGCLTVYGIRQWGHEDANAETKWKAIPALIGVTVLILSFALLLYMTGSKGGAVALLISLVGTGLIWLTKVRGMAWSVGTGTLLILLSGAGIWMSGLAERTGAIKSLRFRQWYASAAVQMIRSQPSTGVGLHNFQFLYPTYKGPCAGETSRAHNDYLDVTAETGIPGGMLFLLFWVAVLFGLVRSFVRDETAIFRLSRDPPDARPAWFGPYGLCGGIGILGLLLLYGLNAGPTFRAREMLTLLLITVLVWFLLYTVAVHVLFRTGLPDRTSSGHRLVLLAALLFYLVHALVDFDLYVPAAGTTIFMIAALASFPEERETWVELSPGKNTGMGLSLLLFLGTMPLLMKSSTLMNSAFQLRSLRSQIGDQAPEETIKAYRTILSNRSDDVSLQSEVASFYHTRFCHAAKQADADDVNDSDLAERFRTCLQHLDQAIKRNPRDWSPYAQKARHIREHRQWLQSRSGGTLVPELRDAESVSPKARFQALQKAVQRYPTRAKLLYRFGRALLNRKQTDRARKVFQKALRIHRCQDLKRMGLSEDARSFIQNWLERH